MRVRSWLSGAIVGAVFGVSVGTFVGARSCSRKTPVTSANAADTGTRAPIEDFDERLQVQESRAKIGSDAELEGQILGDLRAHVAVAPTSLEIDCRSALCRLRLTAADYEAAKQVAPKVVHVPFTRPCSIDTVLKPPARTDVAYVAVFLLACS